MNIQKPVLQFLCAWIPFLYSLPLSNMPDQNSLFSPKSMSNRSSKIEKNGGFCDFWQCLICSNKFSKTFSQMEKVGERVWHSPNLENSLKWLSWEINAFIIFSLIKRLMSNVYQSKIIVYYMYAIFQ